MKIRFYKYHGAGNDFILIDNRKLNWTPEQDTVIRLCNRHFGIGADGLMLLSDSTGFDFGMTYLNSDGNESTMCGNGGRCITAFAHSLGIIGKKARFKAIDGEHYATILNIGDRIYQIMLKMKDVKVEEQAGDYLFLDTGSPHYILFGENISRMDIVRKARKIRYNTCFAEEGTNVDFVEIRKDHLFVRTYERGVEDETLSCGTGVTAAAIAFAIKLELNPGSVTVHTQGGELKVSFTREGKNFKDIWLQGPAEFVFAGEIDLQE